mgnify:FL=1
MQDIDNLSKYGQSFQSKVVSALLTDNKFLDQISEIVTPKFFESDANKWIVSEIVKLPGQDLLSVDKDGKEVLIPMVKQIIISIDVETKKIVVNPPEGLLDVAN